MNFKVLFFSLLIIYAYGVFWSYAELIFTGRAISSGRTNGCEHIWYTMIFSSATFSANAILCMVVFLLLFVDSTHQSNHFDWEWLRFIVVPVNGALCVFGTFLYSESTSRRKLYIGDVCDDYKYMQVWVVYPILNVCLLCYYLFSLMTVSNNDVFTYGRLTIDPSVVGGESIIRRRHSYTSRSDYAQSGSNYSFDV